MEVSRSIKNALQFREETIQRRVDAIDYTHEVVVAFHLDDHGGVVEHRRPQNFIYCTYYTFNVPVNVRDDEYVVYWIHFYATREITKQKALIYLVQYIESQGGIPFTPFDIPAEMHPSDPLNSQDFWSFEELGDPTFFNQKNPTHYLVQERHTHWRRISDGMFQIDEHRFAVL